MIFTLSRGVLARRGVLLFAALPILTGATQDIRIATYNTQGDVSSPTPTGVIPNIATVIEGIGQQQYVGDGILQLPDIVALQETTSNTASVAPIVSDLNSFYSSTAPFAYSTYQATQSGSNNTGNGPNALIYNKTTLSLMASVGVGTPGGSSNGEYRQVVRYEFQPLADVNTSNGIFYVYDSHYKSGGASTKSGNTTDGALRTEEATIIRNDEAANVPSTASVIYVGDYNGDGSTEPAYQVITAVNSPTGVAQGQGIDPRNPPNSSGVVNDNITWTANNSNGLLTESDSSLYYRDDLQTMTTNVYNGSGPGLHYITGSYHTFGNNGSVATNGAVYSGAGTALNDLVPVGAFTKSTVFAAMNASVGSDHLPVVADYAISIIANGIWNGGTGNWSNAAYWSNNVVPNSSSLEVKIDNGNPINSVVTLDIVATVSDLILDSGDTLNIGSAYSLTMAGSTPSMLNGTLSNSGALSAVNIVNTGTFSSAGSLAISGTFNNSGTAVYSGSQGWQGYGSLLNTAGSFTFNSDAGTPISETLGVYATGGTVTFASAQHLAYLSLATGASVVVTPPASSSSRVLILTYQLAFGGTANNSQGKLDLSANDLDVEYGSLSTITSELGQGFNGGAWNSANGIISSAAAADSTHLTALGVIQNNQSGAALYTSSNTFDNNIPSAGAVLVKYTYYGDANLDGKVDASDYSLIDSGYLTGATGWYNGDFNYDGVINGSDYTLIDNAFNSQGAALTSQIADPTTSIAIEIATGAAVPEPTTLSLLAMGTAALLGRRRR